MPSEADRLAAEGTSILLADGGEARLRFTLRTLKRCEDRYGTLDATVAEIHWLLTAEAEGSPEGFYARMLLLLQTVTGDDDIDPAGEPRLWVDALLDAWLEAFPAPEGKAEGEATAPRSPGAPGGASPSATHT